MKHILILPLFFAILAISCSTNSMSDTESPIIQILSPEYSSGDEYFSDSNSTINIDVNVTDNDELHEVHLSVVQDFMRGVVTGSEVFSRHYHPDANELVIDEAYVIDTAHHSNIWIYIEANDHNMNSAKDSVLVHVHH